MELSLLTCTTHCNKSSRSRFHNCLPLYLLSSSDADKTGLRSLQYLFWSQAYQTVIIAFFQKGCYRKKGTWDAKNFKRHFNYKISLCGAKTLKHSTSFLTDFSDLTLYSVTCKAEEKIYMQTCAHTHTHIQYIHRSTRIYLQSHQFPKQRTKADDRADSWCEQTVCSKNYSIWRHTAQKDTNVII